MLKEHVNWTVLLRPLICITFVVFLFNSNIAYAGPWYGYADVVLDYYDSGAYEEMAGPYGGCSGYSPISVTTDVVLGDDTSCFLSLPTGSYVTVVFIDETIVDGPYDDFGILEQGNAGDQANVYISSDLTNFTFIGTARSGTITYFDLAKIEYTDPVIAIKIVGLDELGNSPGFDLVHVRVESGSIGPLALIEAFISFICKDSSGNNVAIFDVYGNLFLKGGLSEGEGIERPVVSANDEFVILDSDTENPEEVAIIDTSTGDMKIYGSLYDCSSGGTSQYQMNTYSENFIIRDSTGNVKANIDYAGDLWIMGKVLEIP